MARLWHTWLPSELQPVVSLDTGRLEAAIEGFEAVVRSALRPDAPPNLDKLSAVVTWMPLINNFIPEKTPYPTPLLDKLAALLLEVILNASEDVEVQVRCAETLSSLLRIYRKDLTINIEWRPFYKLLRDHFLESVPKLEGLTLAQTRLHSLTKLVRRSRRYFPDGAAAEIWEEFSPDLSNHRAGLCYEALGWLLLFFPAHELSRLGELRGIDCDTLLDRWLSLWDSIVHSHFWNCHWMHMFAKLSKHDIHGRMPWQQHLDTIFTHILWVYQVPVGTAVANTPIHETVNGMGKYLFSSQSAGLSRNAGKLIVYLLRERKPSTPDQHPETPTSNTIVHLESLVDLLHQYYHPSNGGSWTTDLTKVMHSMVKHFMKQLSLQGHKPELGNTYLPPASQQRFVECVVTLASMAQFSKYESLSNSAAKALSQLSYIAPDVVLPLVFNRFQTALETATATHQLVAAIVTLAACVRPMLLLGWTPDSDPSTPSQMLAQAMMALLPGIDANDEAKTLAVLMFYRAILSSIPFIPDPEDPPLDQDSPLFTLPVYWEEWLDELVSRCVVLLENLDAGPSHHAADQASSRHESSTFLLAGGDRTYTTFIGVLFAKLPPRLGSLLVKRVADFILGGTIQGVAREASVLVNAAATNYPEQTEKLILRPLIQRLLDESPEPSLTHLSNNLENTIWWHTNLLIEAAYPLSKDAVLRLLPDIKAVINKLLVVNARRLQLGAGTLLATVVMTLVRYHLPEPACSSLRVGAGLEGWVDKTGSGLEPPTWCTAGPQHMEAAQQLMMEYLVGGCEELVALCNGTSAGGSDSSQQMFKQQMNTCLSKIRGILLGLMRYLRDFEIAPGSGTPIHIVGPLQGMLGPEGIREKVAGALVTAGKTLRGRDADSLRILVTVVSILLSNGSVEYNAWVKNRSEQRRIATSMMEPAAASTLQPAVGGWRKRWPLWVALDEVRMALVWRGSQSAFRNYATSGRPVVTDPSELPLAFRELLSELVLLSTHQYKSVRNDAGAAVETCCKRFTGLANFLVPQYLATLATGTLPNPSASADDLAESIAKAMDAAAAEAGTAAQKEPLYGNTESEQDGLVLGSCYSVNNCITMRRLMFRSPVHFRMLLQTLMASRQWTSSASQAGINELVLGICGRLKLPPALLYTDPEYTSLATQFLQLSKPTNQAARWRHTLLANILTLFLMPPVESPLAPTFTKHFLELFMSDLLLLRQVAAAGLFFQLLALVDHGSSNPEVVDIIKHAVSDDPQFLQALLKHFANGHSNLDMHEANKDKRGGTALSYGSMLLNMTFEQISTRVVSASATRFYVWPEGSDIPGSLSEGWFEVSFAAFVRLLACLAPEAVLRTVKEPLVQLVDRVVVPNSGSEKAEQCTCAEVTAGLLASGAPWLMDAAGSQKLETDVDMTSPPVIPAKLPLPNQDLASENSPGNGVLPQAGVVPQGGNLTGNGSLPSTGDSPPLGTSNSAWVLGLLEQGFKHSPTELVHSWSFAVRFALRGLLDAARSSSLIGNGHPNDSAKNSTTSNNTPSNSNSNSTQNNSNSNSSSSDSPPGLAPRKRVWRSCGVPPEQAREAISTLLNMVLNLKPTGEGPGQLLARQKQLQLAAQCVAELRQSGAMSDPVLSEKLMGFWSGLVGQLSELASGDLYSIREHLGVLLVDVATVFGVVETLPWPPAVQSSLIQLEQGQSEAATSATSAPMETDHATTTLPPDTRSITTSPVQSQVRQLCLEILTRFYSSVTSLQSSKNADETPNSTTTQSTPNTTAPPATTNPNDRDLSQIAHAGFGLQFITKAIRKGRSAQMRPVLATLLPGLMQLQDLAGPQVQNLALEAKSSFVLVKYVPLLPVHVPVVVDTILQAANSRSWSTRAAALVYLQYFWFRHRFLLSGPDSRRLEDFVVGRLQDEKAEVRGIAAATLSGMLKAIPPEDATTLRTLFVGRAKKAFGKRNARKAGKPGDAPALLERQACVQGLKAFVIAHPYDCPAWMPEVLLALAGGSNDASAQVRTDVHTALAEFKRTHEQDSIEELKSMMDSDQWDSVNQLTSQASYFT